jgi:hypothetical protein
VHGRDKKFRPCIIIDASVIAHFKQSQPDLFDMDALATATIFIMEYVKKHMFLPGQIEQWVVITNLSKLSIN